MAKQARIVLLMTAAILSCMLFWAWGAREEQAVPVTVTKAAAQDIYNSISVPGRVEASRSFSLVPDGNAKVTAVFVQPGESVAEGDALFTLTESDAVQPGLVDAQSVLSVIGNESSETVRLSANGVARAALNGAVLSVPAAGQNVLAGVPCARLADLKTLQVRVEVPELYISEIMAGQRANVTSEAVPDAVFGAYVQSVAPVASRAMSLMGEQGSAKVEAVLPLQGDTDELRAGYSVSAKLFADQRTDAVVVPYAAIRQQGEQEYVLVLDNGIVRRHDVETGYMLEQVTEVRSGLGAGELVIVSSEADLADGVRAEAVA